MQIKQTILIVVLFLLSLLSISQVGIGTSEPHLSSILEVKSTEKGFLPPRMSDFQRDAITAPAGGLTIFNTTKNCLQWYDGSFWFDACSGSLKPEPLPANISLSAVSSYIIASAFDSDYLDLNGLPINTTLAQLPGGFEDAADASTNDVLIDFQGILTTLGVIIRIPYSVASSSVTLPAYSQTITIPSNYTQDGIATQVKFSYAEQTNLSVGTGFVEATLQAVGTDLQVIKLDLNSGFGADYLGFLLGKFTYALDPMGAVTDLELRATPGVPDRKIGQTINGTIYNYLYIPIQSATGKQWLNNNLGAAYSTIGGSDFNTTQQATALDDFKAYGNLYQWGRASDGHDKITWTSSTAGIVANNTTTLNADLPGNALFITEADSPWDWRSTSDINLWATEASTNNPCPHGWRVPTDAELDAERAIFSAQTPAGAFNSVLKLTFAGQRNRSDGLLSLQGVAGSYWNSSPNASNARYLFFANTSAYSNTSFRSLGFSVRCIKE